MESYDSDVVNCNAASLLGVIKALKTGGVIFIEGGIQVAQGISVKDSAPEAEPRMASVKVAESSQK
jgi:hypothetical protein